MQQTGMSSGTPYLLGRHENLRCSYEKCLHSDASSGDDGHDDGNDSRLLHASSGDDSHDDGDNSRLLFNTEDKEIASIPNAPLEEDMYGMVVCSLVRDLYFVRNKIGTPVSRFARLSTTLFLLVVCTVIQLYLLREIKHVVDAKAVHDIREAYNTFEEIMYDDHVLTPNGKHRGLGPIKDASTFYDDDLLDEGTRASICDIPLSQPMFIFVVLLIWTLTCMEQFRKPLEIFNAVIVGLPTYPDMKAALQTCEEDETDNVMGLTLGVKSAIVVLVIIPQVCITAILLWLGCRWLLATSDFACLILNAVALEFVLCLKDLIYNALVPPRSMHDLARTLINTKRREQTTTMAFVCTLTWGIVAVSWVIIYMGVPDVFEGAQQVLPGYKWDVHEFCKPWMAWRFCVQEPCPASAYDAYMGTSR